MEEQKQSLLKARWCPLILLLLFLALLKAEKRCSFITSNSDPIYMAYHDEEWGVFIHDDKCSATRPELGAWVRLQFCQASLCASLRGSEPIVLRLRGVLQFPLLYCLTVLYRLNVFRTVV
ncbi:hypothetical protein CsSME_00029744 [Camellia sinensis var. sinensis]